MVVSKPLGVCSQIDSRTVHVRYVYIWFVRPPEVGVIFRVPSLSMWVCRRDSADEKAVARQALDGKEQQGKGSSVTRNEGRKVSLH